MKCTAWVEVNEGVVEITRQGADWWHKFMLRHRASGRFREVTAPCIVGGLTAVQCDDREHADWLAKHMVEFGGLPRTAVKVRERPEG